MLDTTGHVTTWNAGAQRINGYAASEIIGKHISIFYPESEPDTKASYELAIALSTGQYQEEGWRVRRDGSRFLANVVITPIRTATGALAGFAKVTRDLTERRAAEDRALDAARRLAAEEAGRIAAEARTRELRALALQLEQKSNELQRQSLAAETANRVKGEFLAAMSHELRTPLNAIGGYAQLMELGIGGPVTAEQRQHLERIQRSQQHLLGIINDILNFSRIEAGQLEYHIEPVALCDVLDTGTAMVTPQAAGKRLALHIARCGADVVALADRSKVEQVLLNLLSNAVKFTPAGGEIELSVGMDGNSVWVKVRDSGVGIAPEYIDTIFSPFTQVGRTLASPKEGTGLGLAIARDLARAMKGDLSVVSEPGVGSTFTLRLPRATQAA
jgi:PAS domain S-box-containing protein